MEILTCVYILFLLTSFMIISLKLIPSSTKSSHNPKLPHGSTGLLPYVGETLQFSIMGKNGTPEKFFMDRMKKYSQKVFKTSLIGQKTAVFCGVSGNKFLFSNENKLVSVSWPSNVQKIFPHSGKNIAEMNEATIKLRRNLHGVFNPESLRNWVEIVDTLAKDHLNSHCNIEKDDQNINALDLAKQFAFSVSCKLFLDIDDVKSNKMTDLGNHFELVVEGIFSLPINFVGTAFNRGIKASNSIRKELLEIIRQRKNDPKMSSNDYLSSLLKERDDNGRLIDDLKISDQLLATLIGGRDSTASAITSIIKYLAEYPLVYEEVLKEQRSIAEAKTKGELLDWNDLQKLKYTWNVVAEVLRLLPPLQGNFREALTDFSYSNFFIPKGWKLYWSPNTTHRNPDYFPDPEKFDPSRFERRAPIPYAYVPFGGGSRICPGKDIARLIILVFVYNIVGKYRWQKLVPNEKTVILPVPFPGKGLPVRLFLN